VEQYRDALLKEIEARREELVSHNENSPRTLYIGGGTPSVLPLSVLSSILDKLYDTVLCCGAAVDVREPVATHGLVNGRSRPAWQTAGGCLQGAGAQLGGMSGAKATRCQRQSATNPDWEEFTVEVNPDDVVKGGLEYARGLRELGVTRVSMGVQSFDDSVLRWMNRRHSAGDARAAFGILREAGFDNISIDLIFGYESESWRESVAEAIALHPEHISAYQLSIEPDSALEKMVEDGRFTVADEELCRGQYDLLCSMLAEAGYEHYEISNFALPGREARHNSGYWRHCRYVGLGPGAHSFDGERTRSWNDPDLKAYISERQTGSEELTEGELAEEKVMLGLRTSEGVDEAMLAHDEILENLMASGALVEAPGGRLRIPEDHFFVSDSIITDVNCYI